VGFCEYKDLPSLSGLHGGQEDHKEIYMNLMVLEDEGVPATGQEPFSKRR